MGRIASLVATLLILFTPLCASSSVTFEQTQWAITSMTDQNQVSGGIFPYSYDTSQYYYTLHLAGKVNLLGIDQEDLSSLSISVYPAADGFYFVSSDASKPKIPFTLEIFVRSRPVGAYSDTDVPITGAVFGGSGEHALMAVEGSYAANARFLWLKGESNAQVAIPVETPSGTKYQNTHVDILVVFDRDYSDVLTRDYRASFFCNYTKNGSDTHSFPFTILGTGTEPDESSAQSVKEHSFSVTPLSLADRYPLDAGDVIRTYQSIATLSYRATISHEVYTPPSITDSYCSIVLSPTSDYLAGGSFSFVNTRSSSIRIPYYLELVGTGTSTLFMSDSVEMQGYYTSTSTDLRGDESTSYPSAAGRRRYVVVPMVVDGTTSRGDYSKTYSYQGEIRIKIPDDIYYGTSGLTYQEALSSNQSGGYFAAGTFKSTIYISTVVRY